MHTKNSQIHSTELQTLIIHLYVSHRLRASDEIEIDNHFQNDIRTTGSNLIHSVRGRLPQMGKTRNKGSPHAYQGL